MQAAVPSPAIRPKWSAKLGLFGFVFVVLRPAKNRRILYVLKDLRPSHPTEIGFVFSNRCFQP